MGNDKNDILIEALCKDTEFPELLIFSDSYADANVIGKFISAIANTAATIGEEFGQLVWGIDPTTGEIVGTEFAPQEYFINDIDLTDWLKSKTENLANFFFTSFELDGKQIVVLEISCAASQAIRFENKHYLLAEDRSIIESTSNVSTDQNSLESSDLEGQDMTVANNLETRLSERINQEMNTLKSDIEKLDIEKVTSIDPLLQTLDVKAFFDLLDEPIPSNEQDVIDALVDYEILIPDEMDDYKVSEIGLLCFAKDLSTHPGMRRKHLIITKYSGTNRGANSQRTVIETGYIAAIESIVEFILDNTRTADPITGNPDAIESPYPARAIKELVINAMVHQSLDIEAVNYASPEVEIFDDRIEISNTGYLDVNAATLANTIPMIRNIDLYSMFTRLGLCNHRQHGWQLIIEGCEQAQSPSPMISGLDMDLLIDCIDSAVSPASYDELSVDMERLAPRKPAVAALSLVGEIKAQDDQAAQSDIEPESVPRQNISLGQRTSIKASDAQRRILGETNGNRVIVVLKHPVLFRNMTDLEREMAAYWHSCVLFCNGLPMTNTSLRDRFSLGKSQTAQVSRLLKTCTELGIIKLEDADAPLKLKQYLPAWA